jgi:hypothetical protein
MLKNWCPDAEGKFAEGDPYIISPAANATERQCSKIGALT